MGALLQEVDRTGTVTAYLPGYDGNGNVSTVSAADGTLAGAYEYSPYGETLRAEGAPTPGRLVRSFSPLLVNPRSQESETCGLWSDLWPLVGFAVQHLAAVGRALFGEDQTRLKTWLKPLARQLKKESAVKVVRQLEEILTSLPAGSKAAAVRTEVNYFHEHQERMDYRTARRRGEPLGSGAIEATCRQYQCRFKRPGQFWSRTGDEALLCLETFWRKGRGHLLFPHAPPFDPARN